MAAYAFKAINSAGVETAGELHAPDSASAREQLRVRGLLATRLNELDASGEVSARTAFKKVKPKSLQIFSRQFATMIEAGLNVVSALVILEQQTDDVYLGSVIRELRADVEGGMLLSQSMARHPKVFNRLYVSMVEAGEAAGILDIVLDRVAFQIEKEAAIKRRVKGAMIYPTMVLIFATLVLAGMLLFLVPIFVSIFDQLGGDLPMLTQWVLMGSNFLKATWFILLPGSIIGIFGLKKFLKTDTGRRRWDAVKLKLPMKIGDVVLKVTMARFSRTLSTLVAAGVDIIKALEITGTTSGNWVVENALAGVRQKVGEGVPIAQPLVENPVFPAMVSQMVKIGDVVLKVTMARFSRTLSTLVAAGVDIIKALEITGTTSGNWVVENALAGVRQKVGEGVPIAQPLVENPVFPAMVSQMVKIGEETGELEKMLGKVADFYEDEVDASVQALTSIVEPIMMLGVGLMVGIVIISMYLPMFKLLTLIK